MKVQITLVHENQEWSSEGKEEITQEDFEILKTQFGENINNLEYLALHNGIFHYYIPKAILQQSVLVFKEIRK